MKMHNQDGKWGGRQQQVPEFFDVVRYFKSKKKYPCKKNKGEHTWEHIESKQYRFFNNDTWREYRCTACGKQDYETSSSEHNRFASVRRDDIIVITR